MFLCLTPKDVQIFQFLKTDETQGSIILQSRILICLL